jgi:hypothetical protein
MKNILIGFLLLISIMAMPGCSGNTTATEQITEGVEGENAMVTDSTQQLAYVCPMRCEGSGSNEPGKCKVCDMDLVKNPDHKAAHDSVSTGSN